MKRDWLKRKALGLLGWVGPVVLVFAAAAWYTQSPTLNAKVERLYQADAPGQPVPDLPIRGFDGEPIVLSELRGKPVLLDFWASWCPSCRMSMPGIAALQEEYGDDLIVLAVNVYESLEDGRAYAAEHDYPLRYVRAPELAAHLDIRGLPSIVLLDPRGRVDWAGVGHVPLLSNRILELRVAAFSGDSSP